MQALTLSYSSEGSADPTSFLYLVMALAFKKHRSNIGLEIRPKVPFLPLQAILLGRSGWVLQNLS
jgi:hypothetical protein